MCAVDGFETGQKLESGQLENNGRAKQIPLLLMHGEKDKICDVAGSRNIAARMKADGENIEYIEWSGLYHEIHNGGPQSRGDEVIAKAVEWAEKIDLRRADQMKCRQEVISLRHDLVLEVPDLRTMFYYE